MKGVVAMKQEEIKNVRDTLGMKQRELGLAHAKASLFVAVKGNSASLVAGEQIAGLLTENKKRGTLFPQRAPQRLVGDSK